jgi:sugar lactone lactonase YvrE
MHYTHRRSLTSFAVVAALTSVFTACKAKESGAGDSALKDTAAPAAAAAPAAPTPAGETGGFKTPESVRYDADLDVFFVSNINGNPSQKDGNGYIARVDATNPTGVPSTVIEGGKNGVTLNAPKGMAIVGDTLWVADIDAVRAFNKRTGAPIATIELQKSGATFLNDVAVGGDGAIYITDTGVKFAADGAMTHPGTDHIFKIAGRTATVAAQGDSLARPNGIVWDATNNRFLLGPFNGTSIQSWKPGDANPTTLVTGPGGYDGIEILPGGRIAVTSWADSAVHIIDGQTVTKAIPNLEAPADLGLDTKRNVLAVPRFNAGKVEYFKM